MTNNDKSEIISQIENNITNIQLIEELFHDFKIKKIIPHILNKKSSLQK